MRVGIVTYHFVRNYGAVWQAVAMCQALQKLGIEPVVVDYRPQQLKLYYRRLCWNSPLAPARLIRERAFGRFINKYLPLESEEIGSFEKMKSKDFSRYDAIICCADVWQKSGIIGVDMSYFLGFLSDSARTRRISYAASCGPTKTYPKDLQPRLSEALDRFHALSVRDENTKEFVRRLTGRPPTPVIDSVFIGDLQAITESKIRQRGDYILIYTPNTACADLGISIGRSLGLPVIAAQHPHKQAARNLLFVSPDELLGYFKNAHLVVTTYFHGVMLSILFRRNFIAISDGIRDMKIASALRDFGLSDRFHSSSQTEVSELVKNYAIDYGPLEPRIARLSESSLNFLANSLGLPPAV